VAEEGPFAFCLFGEEMEIRLVVREISDLFPKQIWVRDMYDNHASFDA